MRKTLLAHQISLYNFPLNVWKLLVFVTSTHVTQYCWENEIHTLSFLMYNEIAAMNKTFYNGYEYSVSKVYLWSFTIIISLVEYSIL